jgi:cystathionine beta-lyase/cystathionine gamma-synthase
MAFASGLAAMDNLMKILKPGDEVISTNDLYGGSYRLFNSVFANYGIIFHFINLDDPKTSLDELVNENTKMIWIETPTNPMMQITDIEAVANAVKGKNILVCVDNTFATPMLQQPLALGADLVMHSATKYLGGHSDVVMGCLMVNDDALDEKLRTLQNSCGAIAGPMDSFLVLRGIKTLHLRMKRHSENGRAVVDYLKTNDHVEKIYWPGLESHPGHQVAARQMSDFGGMIAFTIKGDDLATAYKFIESTELFTLAESLGGVESLIGHPASMTHASIPKEVREKVGVTDGLIRLSLGVEDAIDIIDDLKLAFKAIS